MHDINFIRQRIVPESRKKVITAIMSTTVLALGLTLASICTATISDIRTSNVYAAEITELRENVSEKYPGLPKREEVKTIVSRTEPYLRDIGKMVDERIRLTPLWERIAMAVPDGIWLTRVSVADPQGSVEEGRGAAVRSYRGIVIEGVALAGRGPEGDEAVAAFVANLENDEELRDIVTGVEFMGTGLEQVGGTSVVGFEITCPF